MELKQIQAMQKEFILSRKWERFNASQTFVHLIEELGEIGSHILYDERYKVAGAGHKSIEEEKAQLSREFAQSFNLFLQLAISLDIDLEDAWNKEFKLMQERFSEDEWKRLAEEDL